MILVDTSVWIDHLRATGEQGMIFLGINGHVDPEPLAVTDAENVEDCWSESSPGWGQQVRAVYAVLSPRLTGSDSQPGSSDIGP